MEIQLWTSGSGGKSMFNKQPVPINTYFFLTHDGKVYRKDIPVNSDYPLLDAGYKLAAFSNQVILMTKYGRGKTVKNRYSEKPQYFTRKEMVMLSLQAEPA
jgi:hypothetical protein